MSKAIVLVAFGSANLDGIKQSIGLLEQDLNEYFDVILYAGVFLVMGGFLYAIMKLDNIKIGQTVIIGGIATMLLSCVV